MSEQSSDTATDTATDADQPAGTRSSKTSGRRGGKRSAGASAGTDSPAPDTVANRVYRIRVPRGDKIIAGFEAAQPNRGMSQAIRMLMYDFVRRHGYVDVMETLMAEMAGVADAGATSISTGATTPSAQPLAQPVTQQSQPVASVEQIPAGAHEQQIPPAAAPQYQQPGHPGQQLSTVYTQYPPAQAVQQAPQQTAAQYQQPQPAPATQTAPATAQPATDMFGNPLPGQQAVQAPPPDSSAPDPGSTEALFFGE